MAGEGTAESLTGQFHKRFVEHFDLMIEGKCLDELKRYRLELIDRGIAAGETPDETFLDIICFARSMPATQFTDVPFIVGRAPAQASPKHY
jgi:hypothetical protein